MQIDYKISMKRQAVEFFDWSLFLLASMLVAAGLISLYSATFDSQMSSFFYKQLISAGIGFAAMFIFAFLPERLIYTSSYVIYGISLLLLVLVLIFGIEVYGTKGWLNIGGLSMQPSELTKFGILLAIARHLSTKGTDIRSFRDMVVILVLLLVPVALIIKQPDFGTATVLFALVFGIFFWSGFDIFTMYFVICTPAVVLMSLKGQLYFIISAVIFSILAFLFRKRITITVISILIIISAGYLSPIMYDHLMPHQKDRLENFLNPGQNPLGSGYNVIQSILAVGSGGLIGKGYLQGTQTQLRYIPMQWSDFIFSVPTEEFGFIGGVFVILLHVGIIIRSINIASEINNKFFSLIAIGAASMYLYHVAINIGMAIGVMPVMGIPLPFMSYGGTSLIVNLSLVGLMLNAYRSNKLKRIV